MDRTGIIVITLCAILFGVWVYAQNKFAQQQAQYAATHHVATNPAPAAATGATGSPIPLATMASSSSAQTGVIAFDTNAPEHFIIITNADARYTFTSRGGG